MRYFHASYAGGVSPVSVSSPDTSRAYREVVSSSVGTLWRRDLIVIELTGLASTLDALESDDCLDATRSSAKGWRKTGRRLR